MSLLRFTKKDLFTKFSTFLISTLIEISLMILTSTLNKILVSYIVYGQYL